MSNRSLVTNFKPMIQIMKTLIAFFVAGLLLASCEKEETPVDPSPKNQIETPDSVQQNDTLTVTDSVIFGPKDEDHDYYISMCYSGEQPTTGKNYFYFLFTCTHPDLNIQTLSVSIQNQEIDLSKEIYFGEEFHIGYFYMDYAETFNYKIIVNGEETVCNLPMIDDMIMTLPTTLTDSANVNLNWQMNVNPQTIYIEGFQYNSSGEILKKTIKNLSSEKRSFTMPADWLWTNDVPHERAIQVGVMNYKIENRICFTISDGEYKTY